jgi:hypothetical protein
MQAISQFQNQIENIPGYDIAMTAWQDIAGDQFKEKGEGSSNGYLLL